jgi:hypothetical protein
VDGSAAKTRDRLVKTAATRNSAAHNSVPRIACDRDSVGGTHTGKIIGPLGLALITGSSDFISPKATIAAIGPAFTYFAFWWIIDALTFWLIGFETKGRSIEEIDRQLDGPLPAPPRPVQQTAGN